MTLTTEMIRAGQAAAPQLSAVEIATVWRAICAAAPVAAQADADGFVPVAASVLHTLAEPGLVKRTLGKFSPAMAEKMGFTPEEAKAIEALYFAFGESFDYPVAAQAQPPKLTRDEMEALHDFQRTIIADSCHTLGKPMITRLTGVGALESMGFGKHRLTEYGEWLLAQQPVSGADGDQWKAKLIDLIVTYGDHRYWEVDAADKRDAVCRTTRAFANVMAHLRNAQPQPSGNAGNSPANIIDALKFYADRNHFIIADDGAWDTVSGEPQNLWCDEAGTATVEDGSIARAALAARASANICNADKRQIPAFQLQASGQEFDADDIREFANIGKAVNRAAMELPDGWSIHIQLERDAGTVYLSDPDGLATMIDGGGEPFSEQINSAIERTAAKGGA